MLNLKRLLILNFKILQSFFYSLLHDFFYLDLTKDFTALLEDNTLNHCINWFLFFLFLNWQRDGKTLMYWKMWQHLLFELYETEVGSRNTHLRRIYDKWLFGLEFWKLVSSFWIIQTNRSYKNESNYYTCNSILCECFICHKINFIRLTSRLLVFNSNHALNRGKGNNLYDITIHKSIFLQIENWID